ncbi:hypothetical protein ACJJTC_002715 [Scirpophaga incertulas]
MKSLTNSKKIVNILNKYGHCCSYTVLEELETEATFAATRRSMLCPDDIIPSRNLCTGLAFNNFDRFVDTATGKDTLHDTVGIMFQNIVNCLPSLPRPIAENVDEPETSVKRRRRTFDEITFELQSYNKRPKIRENLMSVDSPLYSYDVDIKRLQFIDLAWAVSHFLKLSNVPAWVGYNSKIYEDNSIKQKISYLTTINASPTNTSVILETMRQAQQIAQECSEDYMEVTYDLAIAKVALQLQSTEKPKYDNLFIHLGSFHIMMAYFKAVGKFIDNCGLTNIMENAEILANGSEKSHPGLYLNLQSGSMGVKRTDKPFSRQPVDLTLEQTINADAANKLTGISHTTNSIKARQRWCKSHSIRSKIIAHIMEETDLRADQDITADLEQSRIKRHSLQLDHCITHIKQNMNPFSRDVDKDLLYNISTGQAVTIDIENFLLNVETLGNKQREEFITECSADDERLEKVIKRNKILNFRTAAPKQKMSVAGKLLSIQMQRDLFGQLFSLSLEQTLNVDKVLAYPLTPVPLALCHIDGTICKTDKSALLKMLEKEIDSNPPERCDVIVYDGFFIMHSIRDVPSSFENISKKLLQVFTANSADTVIIAFDRYIFPSIKDNEHSLRKRTKGQRFPYKWT